MRLFSWVAPLTVILALAPTPSLASLALDARANGRPAAAHAVPFVVHLPLQHRADLERLVELQGTPGTQAYHHWLTPAQFRAAYGPTPKQISAAIMALRTAGLSVDRVSAQLITAHATVAEVERAFGADMVTYREQNGKVHIGSRVALTLPAALRNLNAGVEGLDYHGPGHPLLHAVPMSALPLNRYSLAGPYLFDDIKQAYKYPAFQYASGKGVSVATVNQADFSDADLVRYLQFERIGNAKGDLAPLPQFFHVLVPGAAPFNKNDPASGEANLDTQQVAGTAPGATLAGWTTNGFEFPTDFLQVYDYINQANDEDIVSTSYGLCEQLYTAAYNGGIDQTGILHALHDAFLQGNSQGITYTVSSGDGAGRECPEVGYFTHPNANKTYSTIPSVGIPASDPNVVSVGGGNLITSDDPHNSADLNSTYVRESAYADREVPSDPYGVGNTLTNLWFGAGGGQSAVWSKPAWQHGTTPGSTRSVPDIGLFVGGCFADPSIFVQPCAPNTSQVIEEIDNQQYIAIGTSVSAPEVAGLIATFEQLQGSGKSPGAGRLGNVNPLLYSLPARFFHKNIAGYNGVVSFSAGQHWNPSYGLGSLFNSSPFPSAGTPQTPSNP